MTQSSGKRYRVVKNFDGAGNGQMRVMRDEVVVVPPNLNDWVNNGWRVARKLDFSDIGHVPASYLRIVRQVPQYLQDSNAAVVNEDGTDDAELPTYEEAARDAIGHRISVKIRTDPLLGHGIRGWGDIQLAVGDDYESFQRKLKRCYFSKFAEDVDRPFMWTTWLENKNDVGGQRYCIGSHRWQEIREELLSSVELIALDPTTKTYRLVMNVTYMRLDERLGHYVGSSRVVSDANERTLLCEGRHLPPREYLTPGDRRRALEVEPGECAYEALFDGEDASTPGIRRAQQLVDPFDQTNDRASTSARRNDSNEQRTPSLPSRPVEQRPKLSARARVVELSFGSGRSEYAGVPRGTLRAALRDMFNPSSRARAVDHHRRP